MTSYWVYTSGTWKLAHWGWIFDELERYHDAVVAVYR